MLAVHRDRAAAGELRQVDAVVAAGEAQLDPVMDEALASHPVADARLDQQVHRALLEHACADPLLDVVAALDFDHDRLDAAQVQEVREQQARGPGPDDPHLCAHHRPPWVGLCLLEFGDKQMREVKHLDGAGVKALDRAGVIADSGLAWYTSSGSNDQ